MSCFTMSFSTDSSPPSEYEVVQEQPKTIFDYAETFCRVYEVPYDLVYEIGKNESRWPCPENLLFIQECLDVEEDSDGDLQIWPTTWDYLKDQLHLQEKTRITLLHAGIYYLRQQYDRYGSWEMARYAYARGSWKPPTEWTKLEKKFMNKINWSNYD